MFFRAILHRDLALLTAIAKNLYSDRAIRGFRPVFSRTIQLVHNIRPVYRPSFARDSHGAIPPLSTPAVPPLLSLSQCTKHSPTVVAFGEDLSEGDSQSYAAVKALAQIP